MDTNLLLQYIRRNAQNIIFIIVAFTIPFTKNYLPYITFLWVLSWVISIRRVGLRYNYIILAFFPVVFYLIHLIGLIYSNNLGKGLVDIQVKLSLLAIPLIILFMTDKVLNNFKILLKVFIWANFIISIICLIVAFSNSIHFNDASGVTFDSNVWPNAIKELSFIRLIIHRYSYFSYNYLSIIHHPTYFSVYILFSISGIMYIIRQKSKKHIGYYLLILYFIVLIWLLGSRAAFITFFIGSMVYIMILILKFKRYWVGISMILFVIFFSIIIFSNKQIRINIRETVELTTEKSLNKDSDMRLWLWKSGMEVFMENFWFGVGTGDNNQELQKKYQKYSLGLAIDNNYNVHSQYLDVAIKFGVIGLTIFLMWLSYAIYISIKNKQFLFFYFMMIMMINFFFEVMLNSIAGVSFFAFFYSLLYSRYNSKMNLE